MFPQEVSLAFREEQKIAEIKVVCAYGRSKYFNRLRELVQKLSIWRVIPKKSTTNVPPEWKEVVSQEFDHSPEAIVQSHILKVCME